MGHWKSKTSDKKLSNYQKYCEEVQDLSKKSFCNMMAYLFYCFAKEAIPHMCKEIREQRLKIDYLENELRYMGAEMNVVRREAEKYMCPMVKDLM